VIIRPGKKVAQHRSVSTNTKERNYKKRVEKKKLGIVKIVHWEKKGADTKGVGHRQKDAG